MALFRWLTFLLRSLTVTVKVLLFWIYFFADGSICSAMSHHLLGKCENVFVSNSIGFPSNSKWDSPFHCIAYDYSCTDWGSLCNHLAEVPFQDIFKLSASAAASQFCV